MAATVACTLASHSALAYPFYAPPKAKPDTPTFSGDAELGYTRLSGNTNSQTLIAKTRLTWLTGDWLHTLRLEARTVSEDEEIEDEHYLASWRERKDLSGPHYLFGFTRWEQERDSGYDRQLTAIGGYGRQLLDDTIHQLSLEAGPGYRNDRVQDQTSQQLAVAYAATDYRFTLSDTGYFQQQLSMEATGDNTTVRSLSAITSNLTSRLALRLSHEIKHNSQPPDSAAASTDTTTTASLQLSW
ncbi:DUF481 domain-containing protein [Halomonas salinarum]|uniref:DUF481 domain-containing protein n=1 Tax=Halomonas salinarum TaxID=1158993 RepID=UPI00143980B1|nr:DUF481 domain-containing protein [Halomonas salinarum]